MYIISEQISFGVSTCRKKVLKATSTGVHSFGGGGGEGGQFIGVLTETIANFSNRTGEERGWQTLCDKRDNNFVWKDFALNFTFL